MVPGWVRSYSEGSQEAGAIRQWSLIRQLRSRGSQLVEARISEAKGVKAKATKSQSHGMRPSLHLVRPCVYLVTRVMV